MKSKMRKLMLCRNSYSWDGDDFPYVLLKGKWFRDYGFSPGDQVIVSNPEPHTLLMTVFKTAEEMDKERKKV
jgi:hypothetical protein